jgi:hypothetical protein
MITVIHMLLILPQRGTEAEEVADKVKPLSLIDDCLFNPEHQGYFWWFFCNVRVLYA